MIDLTQHIISHTGEPLINSHNNKPMTLADVLTAILTQAIPGEKLTKEEKLKLFTFWDENVNGISKLEISSEEKDWIINRANIMYDSPLLIGRLNNLL